jgi:hypothetical protein
MLMPSDKVSEGFILFKRIFINFMAHFLCKRIAYYWKGGIQK